MSYKFKPLQEFSPVEKRRRYLPHWEQEGCTYFLTWRMADSVPEAVYRPWQEERKAFWERHPKPWTDEVWKEYHQRFTRRMEQWLDAGHGSCALRAPEPRGVVADALRFFQDQRYQLDAFVIMPNHVHVLARPLCEEEGETDIPVCSEPEAKMKDEQTAMMKDEQTGMSVSHSSSPSSSRCYPLSAILKNWKGWSARAINRLLGREGTFWMDETFDHIVRSQRQLEHFRNYIRENPAKAGLRAAEFTHWEQEGM